MSKGPTMVQMMGAPPARHGDLIVRAANLYREQLTDNRAKLSSPGRRAADSLIQSIDAALRLGRASTAADIPFSWRDLRAAPLDDAELLINDFQLGLGRDDAPVIVVGTEHAYELLVKGKDGEWRDEGLVELTFECASQILWLVESNPSVLEHIGDYERWGYPLGDRSRGPYHVYAPAYHRMPKGGHTWLFLGKGVFGAGADWATALSEQAYQIELSAYPEKVAAKGREPTPGRLRFLWEAMDLLRTTARVLLFHGKPLSEIDPRPSLAAKFLGVSHLGEPTAEGRDSKRRRWWYYDHHGRRVVFSRALSGGYPYAPDAEYLGIISRIVKEGC